MTIHEKQTSILLQYIHRTVLPNSLTFRRPVDMLFKIGNEVTVVQSGEIVDCARQTDSGEPSIPYALITKRQADMVSNS